MTFKPSGRQDPDRWLFSSEAGFVVYENQKAIGFQFVYAGEQVFVSLPGKLLEYWSGELTKLLEQNPESKDYLPVNQKPPIVN